MNRKKYLVIINFLLIFMILFNFLAFDFAASNRGFLEIIDDSTKKVIFSEEVLPGDSFSTLYIHSVSKTLVEESFVIDNQYRIILSETQLSSTGAGLPSQIFGEEQFHLQDGKFIISNINRFLPFIPLKIGKTHHDTLFFKEKILDLSKLIGNGLVYIKIKNIENTK